MHIFSLLEVHIKYLKSESMEYYKNIKKIKHLIYLCYHTKTFVFSINPLVGFVYIAHIYNMKDTKKKDFVEGMKHYKTLI